MAAVQGSPRDVGIDLAGWNGKAARRFVRERFRVTLGRSSCLNHLHRPGFAPKRPKKRLLKADPERRARFIREYALPRATAAMVGAKLFFVDEAHCHADVDPRGKWVLKGESRAPRWQVDRHHDRTRQSGSLLTRYPGIKRRSRTGRELNETSRADQLSRRTGVFAFAGSVHAIAKIQVGDDRQMIRTAARADPGTPGDEVVRVKNVVDADQRE